MHECNCSLEQKKNIIGDLKIFDPGINLKNFLQA